MDRQSVLLIALAALALAGLVVSITGWMHFARDGRTDTGELEEGSDMEGPGDEDETGGNPAPASPAAAASAPAREESGQSGDGGGED